MVEKEYIDRNAFRCYSNKNGGYFFFGYLGNHSGDWCKDGIMHVYDVLYWCPLEEPQNI